MTTRPLIALFTRSLREDARLRSTYVLRGLLVAMVLFFLVISQASERMARPVGLEFFRQVLWIDLFILCVVGLTYFSSAITEEKEDDTLGLLRMTDLSPLAILLGKSTARLIQTLLLIAAQLPFMLVAVTMGGLALAQVFAGFAMLLGFSFFLANLGLLWSVVAQRTAGAAVCTGLSLAAFTFLPPWILHSAAVSHASPRDSLERFFVGWLHATPPGRLGEILATGFSGPAIGWHFLINVVLGLACFALAWLLFERCADSGEPDFAAPALAAPASAPARSGPAPIVTSSGRADIPAIPWKDFHFTSFGIGGVVLKAIGAIALCAVSVGFASRSLSRTEALPIGMAMLFLNGLFLLLCLAIDAGRIFKIERRDQTLSALLILPHTAASIVWQKVRGCVLNSWPPLAGALLGVGIASPRLIEESFRSPPHAAVFFYLFCGLSSVIIAGLLLPVLIAWLSLRLRWGALPIGTAIWGVGNLLLSMLCALMFRQGTLVLFPAIELLILGALASSIPATVERAGGEN
jgi:ABC-type transport system involved in multi-copper enzyme maturation permease subunit